MTTHEGSAPHCRRLLVCKPVLLPLPTRRRWIGVRSTAVAPRTGVLALLDILDPDGAVLNGSFEMRPTNDGILEAIAYAGETAASVRITVLGRAPVGFDHQALRIRPLPKPAAMLRLLRREPDGLRLVIRELTSPSVATLARRLRDLTMGLSAPGIRPRSYADWVDAFETWSASDLPDQPDEPEIVFLVFHEADRSRALEATVAALRRQESRTEWRLVGKSDDWLDVLRSLETGPDSVVGILQAGEILPRHASGVARICLRNAGWPDLAIADEDAIGLEGSRTDPDFRPTPNLPMMLSGVLSRGLWLVRRRVLEQHGTDATRRTGPWAEPVRLELWLRRREAGRPNGIRLAHVLSSRRPDVEVAPGREVREVVSEFLARARLPFRAVPGRARVRLRYESGPARPRVTAIVPTTLVADHAERSIRAVLAGTDYEPFDMIVALSGQKPTSRESEIGERLCRADPRVALRRYPSPSFNFARTVNRAAEQATGELLLLLNDDITPIAPDWLSDMAAWFADPRVAAVGARLLYPDRTIQHGGVLLGLATLCYHAFLGLDVDAPDLPIRATLPQQMLAVTGACMLVRAETWRSLGGMDERYPSGFNDVDFCLRLSETGREVILSDATLLHEESKTFGSHWSGDRASFQRIEVERMQRRWQAFVADDPFYNPNLDLIVENAWKPVWPPRRTSYRLPPPRPDLFLYPRRNADRADLQGAVPGPSILPP